MKKVLLTGATGQLGYSLIKTKPENIFLLSPKRKEFDLSNPEECFNKILDIKPDWILNCAAYTSVDLAELNRDFVLANRIRRNFSQSIEDNWR